MTHPVIVQLQVLAKMSPHKEICGVIAQDFTIHPIKNVAKNAASCFVFDKREYFTLMNTFQKSGNKVLCIYHSHPTGDVEPSKADLEYTKRSGVPQIIVSATKHRLVENA